MISGLCVCDSCDFAWVTYLSDSEIDPIITIVNCSQCGGDGVFVPQRIF